MNQGSARVGVWRSIATVVLLGVIGSGCSFSSLTTASNLPQGEGQFFVAPGYSRYQRSQGEPLWAPQLELGGRYGVTDQVEIGGKVWLPGAQLDVKVGLLEGERVRMALDPTLGYLGGFEGTPEGGDTLHVVTMSVPLLLGWRLGDHELVLGPRVVDQIWTGTGETLTANIVAVGSSVGFAWYLGGGVTLMPEVSLGAIVAQTLEDFGSRVGGGGSLWQANVALLFGGHGAPQNVPCPCQPP